MIKASPKSTQSLQRMFDVSLDWNFCIQVTQSQPNLQAEDTPTGPIKDPQKPALNLETILPKSEPNSSPNHLNTV